MPGVESRSAFANQTAPTAARPFFCPLDLQTAILGIGLRQVKRAQEDLLRMRGLNNLIFEMIGEGEKTAEQIGGFEKIPKDSPFYTGEAYEKMDHPIVIAQGFTPPGDLIADVFEDRYIIPHSIPEVMFRSITRAYRDPFLREISRLVGNKSNEVLFPVRDWLSRLGNDVEFGFTGADEIHFKNLNDLIEKATLLYDRNGGKKVKAIGISAGGMLIEIAADHLLRVYGEPIIDTVIKVASPEINRDTLGKFDNTLKVDGLAGIVHGAAIASMRRDPARGRDEKQSLLQELMENYAQRDPDPRIKVVHYFADSDSIVPGPTDPNVKTYGGAHASLIDNPELLDDVARKILGKRSPAHAQTTVAQLLSSPVAKRGFSHAA